VISPFGFLRASIVLIVFLLSQLTVCAHRTPTNCAGGGLNISVYAFRLNGQIANSVAKGEEIVFQIDMSNDSQLPTPMGSIPACDVTGATVLFRGPDLNGNPGPVLFVTNVNLPFGTPPTPIGSVTCKVETACGVLSARTFVEVSAVLHDLDIPGCAPIGTCITNPCDRDFVLIQRPAKSFFVGEIESNYVALSTAYSFTTLAGSPGSGALDGIGRSAQFFSPGGISVDNAGNLYVADTKNNTIRKITPAGVVSTIAGFAGICGNADGVGSQARFNHPLGIAVSDTGDLYVADTGNSSIRVMTLIGTNWFVRTLASSLGGGGANNPGLFNSPSGIAVNQSGQVYVADSANRCIRELTLEGTNWIANTIAGGGLSGADGIGSAAGFYYPQSLTLDADGSIYVADFSVRKITRNDTNWVVSTIAGMVPNCPPTLESNPRLDQPSGIAVFNGVIFVTEFGKGVIRKISPEGTNWVISTLAGNYGFHGGTDGTGTNAIFYQPKGLTVDTHGTLYVADYGNNTIRKVTSAGVVRTLAGRGTSQGTVDGVGNDAQFGQPSGVAVDAIGNVYVADTFNHTIRGITAAGQVSTIAGSPGDPGNVDGIGDFARFNQPTGIAVGTDGSLYVADTENGSVRRITPAGIVSTIAGNLNRPRAIAVANSTNIYVAASTILKFSLEGPNWVSNTFLPFTAAALAIDNARNLYVATNLITPGGDAQVWLFRYTESGLPDRSAGGVSIVRPRNQDGLNTNARFGEISGLAVDSAQNVYVADSGNQTIRKVVPIGLDWLVSTIGGLPGNLGSKDGAGNEARFNKPSGIAVDTDGNLYIGDSANNTIRKGVFTAFGTTNPVPYQRPAMNSQLMVTLSPTNGQWRFPWEFAWRNSGETASNLVAGDYILEFRSLPGYLAPNESVNFSGSRQLFVAYVPTFDDPSPNGRGALTVNMGLTPPPEAAWSLLGYGQWQGPGTTLSNLPPGTYFVEFQSVSNYSKPPNRGVQIDPGVTTTITENYHFAQQAPPKVMLPEAIPSDHITNINSYPFGFNGQLLSDIGYGSGVAVTNHVVLTAAHLVFDDETLSFVSRVHWFPQKDEGIFSPLPQRASSFFVLSGYAAQRAYDRTNGFGAGQSTPQSRNLDVAALYFDLSVAGGGYGGYLSSDTAPNLWLSGNSLKMLVGYPIDASIFGDTNIIPGKMYHTDPQPYALTLATDPVDNPQVYFAPWLLSYPGNSGGPLYVQYNDYFYPAAVYVGTLYQGAQPYASLVRAIDTNVVKLIALAETLGRFGTNNDGGVIRFIPDENISSRNPGWVRFDIQPEAAFAAGGRWRIQGQTNYSTNELFTLQIVSTNPFEVEFKNVHGWVRPANQSVAVHPSVIVRPTVYYTVSNPVLVAKWPLGIGIRGTTGTTYVLERSSALSIGGWQQLLTTPVITNEQFHLLLPFAVTNPQPSFYRARWPTSN